VRKLYIIIATIFMIFTAIGILAGNNSTSRIETPTPVSIPKVDIVKLDTTVQKMINDGLVHSVDFANHIVRIDPAIWIRGDVDSKKQIIYFWSQYFKAKIGYERVQILSNRNDDKLGEYEVWGGMKVY